MLQLQSIDGAILFSFYRLDELQHTTFQNIRRDPSIYMVSVDKLTPKFTQHLCSDHIFVVSIPLIINLKYSIYTSH